jgi:hypothetical protein
MGGHGRHLDGSGKGGMIDIVNVTRRRSGRKAKRLFGLFRLLNG